MEFENLATLPAGIDGIFFFSWQPYSVVATVAAAPTKEINKEQGGSSKVRDVRGLKRLCTSYTRRVDPIRSKNNAQDNNKNIEMLA